MSDKNIEIEAHFIDIDKPALEKKLHLLGTKDNGEVVLKEIIFYDKKIEWRQSKRFLRLRTTKNSTTLTYKHFQYENDDDSPDLKPIVKEIEVEVSDWNNTKLLLEAIDLVAYREQEKKRHTFTLNGVTIDIDTWPSIPPYVEIEGDTIEDVKMVSEKLGFVWEKAIFRGATYIIEHFYGIKVSSFRKFTFKEMK